MSFGQTTKIAAIIGLIFNLVGQFACQVAPSCVDDDGQPVDWYFVYKLPTLNKQGHPFSTGFSYVYLTSKMVAENPMGGLQWRLSDKLITDPSSMVLKTLAPAYGTSARARKLSAIMYNDQLPETEKLSHMAAGNSRRAHAKGALIFDERNGAGLWLSHSTPRWPPMRDDPLSYAVNSRGPGQNFLCINFDLMQSGRQIFNHLIMMQPHVYQSTFGKGISNEWPELNYLLVNGFKGLRKNINAPNRLRQEIETRDGQKFTLFSKSGLFMKDVYSDWIDQELDSDLSVETWRNQPNTLDSMCEHGKHQVNNVQDLAINNQDMSVYWSYTQDHSKWTVTENPYNPYVCITDANRAFSQFSRGSGAICIKNPTCWVTFARTIKQVEPCDYKAPSNPKSKKIKSK